jgi:8-oxo-dGTP pyrophosphatase MutT (NUDIX family)
LQPARWALRLVPGDACSSVAALCVLRDSDGRWLAGRRAAWLASWPGRWALGAGGAVDAGESPAETLLREVGEEWSVRPERCVAEALVRLPHEMIMFIGQAWLPPVSAFRALKYASFTHSTVYAALLVASLTGGETLLLGWAHGLGWIAMSLACITATRLRIIPLRVAVAVVVLGGVGPFFGSYMFVREQRARERVV